MIQYPDRRIHDLDELATGDVVDVWQQRSLCCTGAVEEVAPQLGVLWIRETGTGARRLVSAADHRLCRHVPPALPADQVPASPSREKAEARWAW